MRLLTWNVNGRVGAALDRQLAAVLGRDPDIVALQEVTTTSYDGWCAGLIDGGYSIVSTVDLVALPYPRPPDSSTYPFPPFPPNSREPIRRRNFNLTAARHPICQLPGLSFQDAEEALYAFPEKHAAARVRVEDADLEVHNAHLPRGVSRGVVKVHAFEAIRRRIDEGGDCPRILCGDFNAPLGEDESGPLVERGGDWPDEIQDRWVEAETALLSNPDMRDVYRDVHRRGEAFPASHFTGKQRNPRRYDYIFASADLETESCEYLSEWLERDEEGNWLSDHAPVEAEVSLADQRE